MTKESAGSDSFEKIENNDISDGVFEKYQVPLNKQLEKITLGTKNYRTKILNPNGAYDESGKLIITKPSKAKINSQVASKVSTPIDKAIGNRMDGKKKTPHTYHRHPKPPRYEPVENEINEEIGEQDEDFGESNEIGGDDDYDEEQRPPQYESLYDKMLDSKTLKTPRFEPIKVPFGLEYTEYTICPMWVLSIEEYYKNPGRHIHEIDDNDLRKAYSEVVFNKLSKEVRDNLDRAGTVKRYMDECRFIAKYGEVISTRNTLSFGDLHVSCPVLHSTECINGRYGGITVFPSKEHRDVDIKLNKIIDKRWESENMENQIKHYGHITHDRVKDDYGPIDKRNPKVIFISEHSPLIPAFTQQKVGCFFETSPKNGGYTLNNKSFDGYYRNALQANKKIPICDKLLFKLHLPPEEVLRAACPGGDAFYDEARKQNFIVQVKIAVIGKYILPN